MNRPRRLDESDRKKFLRDYDRLRNIRLLAEKWGIGYQTARRALARWEAETKFALRQEYPGLGVRPDAEIAKELGLARSSIRGARRRKGIAAPGAFAVPNRRRDEFIEHYAALNYNAAALARAWGISRHTCYRALDRFGVRRPRVRRPREGGAADGAAD